MTDDLPDAPLPGDKAIFAKHLFVEGTDDPLEYLLPWEQTSAELWVGLGHGIPDRGYRFAKYRQGFLDALRERCKPDVTEFQLKALMRSNPWIAYVRQLREHARDSALQKVKNHAMRAVDSYLWAEEAARGAGDYKTTHTITADHLDRIGASEAPPRVQVQVATIQLRSRNFLEDNLLSPSPELLPDAQQKQESGDSSGK